MQELLDDANNPPSWDLSDLYKGLDDPSIKRDLENILTSSRKFEKSYRNEINSETIAPEKLLRIVEELERISEEISKLLSYAYLVFASDTNDPKKGAFLQEMQEKSTAIRKHLIFFEIEWNELDDQKSSELINSEHLTKYSYFLKNERKYKPHMLSEEGENLLDIKSNTGSRAFKRLFDEVINNIKFNVRIDGKKQVMSETQTLSLLYDTDRAKRKAGAKGLTRGLKENSKVLTFIFNTLVKDHQSTDEIRHYDYPMHSRNLNNDIDRETVSALIKSTEKYYALVERFYYLKKKLTGIDKFYDYDRYAPIMQSKRLINYLSAKDIVLKSFRDFSEEMYEITCKFFDNNWIDAEVREGKRGGAFSHSTVPSVHPYVFTNFNGKLRDVMTLAHELGHGVHQYLARKQGYFNSNTPLTTSETASVFAEMLVFMNLLENETDITEKIVLLFGKLEEMFATVFRQVIMTKFEERFHIQSRKKGELTTEEINRLWTRANRKMFGKSVTLTKDYSYWWLYIPHFIHSPFYCYAYTFGELLVFSLYQKYLEEGKTFVPKYIDLLSSGGRDTPYNLLNSLDVDIRNPGFWEDGLKYLRNMVDEAEELSKEYAIR